MVNVALPIITAIAPRPDHAFAGFDASAASRPEAKATLLRSGDMAIVEQGRQRENPKQIFSLVVLDNSSPLADFATVHYGSKPGQTSRVTRSFWEIPVIEVEKWRWLESSPTGNSPFDGKAEICFSEAEIAAQNIVEFGVRGSAAWGNKGVIVSKMTTLPACLYVGYLFDDNTYVLVPKNERYLPAIYSYVQSPKYVAEVRTRNPKLNVDTQALLNVPFDLAHWQRVAEERYPDGLPEPYSSDPTQWLFDGTAPGSDQPLQVAMARLLGYRWPEQVEDGLEALADPDGIVCLPSVYQEPTAEQRLRELLRAAYGDAWSPDVLAGLLKQLGAASLEAWLRDRNGFFAQHVRLFHNRPFLWQIGDGRKDGFAAVVNYHRLDARALSKLIHTYLGDWISRQQRDVEAGVAGAPGRLEAATALKAKLSAIAAGAPPYDVYVRWKSLSEQPIGWNPDLNDGVRLNIRPFVEAGVLASKVTVNWNKDRGKDPAVRAEPLLAEATGDLKRRLEPHCSTDRHNDLHFSRAEKERARELARTDKGQSR